jgi:hypothetical protein
MKKRKNRNCCVQTQLRNLCKLALSIFFCIVPVPRPLFAQTIPPVGGRIVDAATREPIRDIAITLQISTYEGFAVHTEVKSTATSDLSGLFSLAGLNHPTESPLEFRSYWLTVNQGDRASGVEEGSAATQVLYNPMSNRSGMPVGNSRYFPITITYRRDGCDLTWSATCMYETSWSGIDIPLIPVLDDIIGCKKIADSVLEEKCRQLNTYRSAFAHVDTYENVQKGKALCGELPESLVKTCLDQLSLYIATSHVPSPQVSLPPGMFVVAIGAATRTGQGCGTLTLFTGHFQCGATYGPRVGVWWVAVSVDQWPDPESARQRMPKGTPNFADYKEATVSDESLPIGVIRLYRGPQFTVAYWVSVNRFVQITFYVTRPEQDEFIYHYLAEFPSVLK